jgi:DUF177 domain-containing protein
MLRVDLRELARGPVDTRGELGQADPLLEGLDVALGGPVKVTGRLQATGEGRFYWHGTVQTTVTGECRRCLTPVSAAVSADASALFTQDADAEEDPDSYPVAPDATEIDLAPAVREEVLLAVPRFLQCREDCRGLCPRCGQDLNAGPCGCPPVTDPRWQALESLKQRGQS